MHVSCPYGKQIDGLEAMGVNYHKTRIQRHGMNPAAEIRLLKEYCRLMREMAESAHVPVSYMDEYLSAA